MKLPTVFTVSDQEQGIKVVTGLMKTQRPFAELLGKDSLKTDRRIGKILR